MPKIKYYQRVEELREINLDSPLPPFDLERLRSKGFVSKLAANIFRSPRGILKLLRNTIPNPSFGEFVLITRAEDVREVLTNTKVFTVPFGPEMKVVSGGGDFVLGTNDGAIYRAQKKVILKAFPPTEMEPIINQITERNAARCLRSVGADFDPIQDLFKPSALAVCQEYFGLIIADSDRFYDSALAVSSFLFADVFGSQATRELAMSGAKQLLDVIDSSIEHSRARVKRLSEEEASSELNALDRLVMAHIADEKSVPYQDLRSIMMGMLLGFLPTTMLGLGNALEIILDKPAAQEAVLGAIKDNDDLQLDLVIAEAMRFNPIQLGPFRLCEQDYVVADGTRRRKRISKGSLVIPSTLSAMFDSNEVDRPDEFRPNRNSQDSMIFGYGIHNCIGAPMARAFSTQIIKKLFSLPDLTINRGISGKLSRIGIFPESISMTWNQQGKYGDHNQSLCTYCIPIKHAQYIDDLQQGLESLGNVGCQFSDSESSAQRQAPLSVDQGLIDIFSKESQIHFASGVISPAFRQGGKEIESAHLLFEVSSDLESANVASLFAKGISPVLGDSIRLAIGVDSSHTMASILEKNRLKDVEPLSKNLGLNFSGTPGHSVKRIHKEAELANTIHQMVLDQDATLSSTNSLERLKAIREELAKKAEFEWAFARVRNRLSEPKSGLLKFGFDYVRQIWVLLPVVIALFFIGFNFYILGGSSDSIWITIGRMGAAISMTLLGGALLFGSIASAAIIYLRHLEKRDPSDFVLPEQSNYTRVTAKENQLRQNHMFSVSRIKPSRMRSLFLRGALWFIKLAAVYKNQPGVLSVINSIHFARWVRIPNTKQLLFFSNYGGSWESYLEDFITKGSEGLTGVWSNTENFPATKYLTKGGAQFSEPFKYWARQQQLPTPFWYVAYPDITTGDIRKNAKIREGFASINDVSKADQWFSLFGSSYRPRSSLDKSSIQTLVFGGMGKRLPFSRVSLIAFDDKQDKAACKNLLNDIFSRIAFGEKALDEQAWQIAFSYRGLERLGLSADRADAQIFPNVFCQGVDGEARARVLGDSGESHRDHWLWGSGDKQVDFVLLGYFDSDKRSKAENKKLIALLNKHGAELISQQDCKVERNSAGVPIEPFGYADGISQPIIKGTSRAQRSKQADELVAPGEFLCGYPDERDNFSPSPVVSVAKDRRNILPQELNQNHKDTRKDFGLNGSYLVIRQLAQKVNEFEDFCQKSAEYLNSLDSSNEHSAEWVGAKMIGRWKDGRPLVRHPKVQVASDQQAYKLGDNDNNFRYRSEDPQGLRCPLGAHVRRANPRDSLGDDVETQIGLSNRHRVLRVGRPYRNVDTDEQGLMFMCLNADIERQFEFVQQTWLGNTGFHDLMGESDVFTSAECPESKRFTIPTEQGRKTLSSLEQFVVTKGSGYFFMPGRQALQFLLNL